MVRGGVFGVEADKTDMEPAVDAGCGTFPGIVVPADFKAGLPKGLRGAWGGRW